MQILKLELRDQAACEEATPQTAMRPIKSNTNKRPPY